MKKIVVQLITYASVAIVAVPLIRGEYLTLQVPCSPWKLAAAVACACLGFCAEVYLWTVLLRAAGYNIRWRTGIGSVGLSALGKYIPGKVWMVVGRAAYVALHEPISLAASSTLALQVQLLMLWLGITLGSLGILMCSSSTAWWPVLAPLWLALALAIFTDLPARAVEHLWPAVRGRRLSLPRIPFRLMLSAMPAGLLTWGFWVAGFHLLVASLSPGPTPLATGFGFPLAATLGILALFAPGGLGIREGILVGYLAMVGLELHTATGVAAASRIWFLIGELFSFAVGLIADLTRRATVGRPTDA